MKLSQENDFLNISTRHVDSIESTIKSLFFYFFGENLFRVSIKLAILKTMKARLTTLQ